MELKEYVLLNNNMIYDLVVERDVEKFNMVKNGNQRAYGIKKTSDNIFDLVEENDLIEVRPNRIRTILQNDTLNKVMFCEDGFLRYEDIKTIYKRQPNGDYKRYEVK